MMSPEGLGKTYMHYSNNTFPKDMVIINLGNYIWGFDLFIEILNFSDRLEIRCRHQRFM